MRRVCAGALSAALAVLGGVLTAKGLPAEAPPPAPPPALSYADRPPPADVEAGIASSTISRRSVPVHLDIPAVAIHSRLVRLGLSAGGTIEVPPLTRDAPAGWYVHSPTPGQRGAAVVLGHVDSARDGAAVFYRLGDLRPGDLISVRRADGGTVKFRVIRLALYLKSAFPTREVYGAVDDPELRLITCGGSFDRSRRSYRSNLVVFARAVLR